MKDKFFQPIIKNIISNNLMKKDCLIVKFIYLEILLTNNY